VLGVLDQYGCGMPLVDEEDAVEEFTADGADEAFGHSVGPRRPLARIPRAWARRNSDHDGPARRGEGSMPARCRMAQTVEAPIW
jgi:hypothetical protein